MCPCCLNRRPFGRQPGPVFLPFRVLTLKVAKSCCGCSCRVRDLEQAHPCPPMGHLPRTNKVESEFLMHGKKQKATQLKQAKIPFMLFFMRYKNPNLKVKSLLKQQRNRILSRRTSTQFLTLQIFSLQHLRISERILKSNVFSTST